MSAELQRAVVSKLNANSTFSDLVLQTGIPGGQGVFWGAAPKEVRSPWVAAYIISDTPDRVFRVADDGDDVVVQFSIFSDSEDWKEVWEIDAAIESALDRQTLTYDTKRHVSCAKQVGTGPTRVEDGWERTIDYLIRNQK